MTLIIYTELTQAHDTNHIHRTNTSTWH